jgi:uncharacterized protein
LPLTSIIDCHAHAGPGLGKTISAAAKLLGRLPRLMPGVESLASLRARTHGQANRVLELIGSVALAPQVAARSSLPDLLDSMARTGIERTVVIASPPAASNDWLLEAARAHPREVIPVVSLPGRPSEDALEALVDRGARGFKIHPNMDPVPPSSPAYEAVFQVASRRGVFVILHTGNFDAFVYRNHARPDPNAFVPLFERHRQVRVCLAHMGRDRPGDVWELMRRFDSLYTDTSWQPAEAVRRAIDTVGADRILLGSDWPLLHADVQRDAVDIVRRAATDEQAEAIGRTNALTFLGLA